uniref:Uncharacterized protein n=1 Tax=Micrurus lemniscatus lemniscatus TaxID=129467 RepID=A0A2D4JIV3_MICLE
MEFHLKCHKREKWLDMHSMIPNLKNKKIYVKHQRLQCEFPPQMEKISYRLTPQGYENIFKHPMHTNILVSTGSGLLQNSSHLLKKEHFIFIPYSMYCSSWQI